jgi:peptidoglycan/LPS O-acetylase OafA/YrhL
MIEKFSASIGLSYNVVEFAITSLSSDVSIMMFCVAQVWIANICINDKLSPLISSIITYISTASYAVYLFHRPILSVWASLANQIHIVPFLQDCITIILIIPALFVISYYIQKNESLFMKRFLAKSSS